MGPSGVVISYMLFFATKRHSFKATLSKSPVFGGWSSLSSISGSASYNLGDWGLLTVSLSLPACEPGLGQYHSEY